MFVKGMCYNTLVFLCACKREISIQLTPETLQSRFVFLSPRVEFHFLPHVMTLLSMVPLLFGLYFILYIELRNQMRLCGGIPK